MRCGIKVSGQFPIARCLTGLICVIYLGGCSVGPDFQPPAPPATTRYTKTSINKTVQADVSGGQAQHFTFHQDIPQQWWTLFHSPELTALIQKGYKNSPNLSAARAALKVAQENVRAGIGSTFFPALTAQFPAQQEKFSGAAFGQATPQTNVFTLLNPSLNIAYTLDVFGGGRRSIEALCALVDYQKYELEAAYLTLAANIVTLAIQQAALQDQINTTKAQIKAEKEILDILQKQLQLGGIPLTTVLTQETQLAQTTATLPPLEKSFAQTQHALAVLVGELPSENQPLTLHLTDLHLPTEIPLSLPSRLVNQRPDVKAAEALMHQASAQIGVATANLLPQFTLTGAYGWEGSQLGSLFNSDNTIWNIGGQVLQPIFKGGSLVAQRRAAIATYEQTSAQYRQAVLQAFQNVADSLRALDSDAKALQAQAVAEHSAEKNFHLTKAQYELGGANYLALLDAQRQYQQIIVNRIQAQANRYLDTVALFQALGGGWWDHT